MVTPRNDNHYPRMGRTLRPYQPGMIYHLTSRLHMREPLFLGREAEVVDRIGVSAAASGAQLLAYAVMPNHLHLIAIQGAAPLARLMQPLLRRTALLIQRELGREGHVFERRYRHTACADPDYVRNAIAYVHMNPVRAGLCEDPGDYRWTSHSAFVASDPCVAREHIPQLCIEAALRLFAPDRGSDIDLSRQNYIVFMRWRMEMDAALTAGANGVAGDVGLSPAALGGDCLWPGGAAPANATVRARSVTPDLRAIALEVVRSVDPPLSLEWLRCGGRSRPLVQVRRAVIARAAQAGYRTGQIARFLGISSSAVSRVAAPLRELPH
jgi:REP element-mobilizing transposase RayT